jgi:hypothetical protein
LRIIHWGARANHESFPITNDGNDGIIEWLIFDTPDEGPRINNCSCIFGGGAGQEPNGGVGEYKFNAIIRNCFFNGAKADGSLVQHLAISCDGIGAVLVENNVITNMWTGGPYRDSWNHKGTIVIRNNFYYRVLTSLAWALGGANLHPFTYDFESRPIFGVASITSVGTVATLNTKGTDPDPLQPPTSLAVGDWFELRGSDPTGFTPMYDGGWQVVSTPSARQITFTVRRA